MNNYAFKCTKSNRNTWKVVNLLTWRHIGVGGPQRPSVSWVDWALATFWRGPRRLLGHPSKSRLCWSTSLAAFAQTACSRTCRQRFSYLQYAYKSQLFIVTHWKKITFSGWSRQSLRNELQLLYAAGAWENWFVEQHFAQNAAKAPHVYALGIAISNKKFHACKYIHRIETILLLWKLHPSAFSKLCC